MKTRLIDPTPCGIAEAAQVLRDGRLLALPTETVYGLAADATNNSAVAGIYTSKGRPSFNPLIIHVADVETLCTFVDLPEFATPIVSAFMPGPLSIVARLRPDNGLSDLVSAGLDTVAIRIPAHPVAQNLLRAFGGPVAAPSANPSGKLSPTTAKHVMDALGGKIAAVLDGGSCDVGLESTILDVSGTMNLTEPQAGSDVGALRSKAVDNGDGTYAVTGEKIFISWGDNDFTENVCHLVLARLPDGREGTKGISLFLVPKCLPDDDGELGKANSLQVVSLEQKVGLHASPTAVMSYDGATGWLVGEPHAGMKAMFTMMNNARLGVGAEGLGVAEAATQAAASFASERRQGKNLVESGSGAIIDHADVRRMLMTMRAQTYAARGICLATAVALDLAKASDDQKAAARAALLTPMAKAFGTDTGIEVANLGIQVHGGMGFVEETGAAQFWRDVRVTAIYEGTNGIQAMDLVGRKLMDGGAAAFALLDEVEQFATEATGDLAMRLATAVADVRAATKWMLQQSDMECAVRRCNFVPARLFTFVWRLRTPEISTTRRRWIGPRGTGWVLLPPLNARDINALHCSMRGGRGSLCP